MIMPFLPNLNKQHAILEMIDHLLPAAAMPPYDGEIVFAAGSDDPIRARGAKAGCHERRLGHLFLAQMDVALEGRRPDLDIEFLIQKLHETVDEMIRFLV